MKKLLRLTLCSALSISNLFVGQTFAINFQNLESFGLTGNNPRLPSEPPSYKKTVLAVVGGTALGGIIGSGITWFAAKSTCLSVSTDPAGFKISEHSTPYSLPSSPFLNPEKTSQILESIEKLENRYGDRETNLPQEDQNFKYALFSELSPLDGDKTDLVLSTFRSAEKSFKRTAHNTRHGINGVNEACYTHVPPSVRPMVQNYVSHIWENPENAFRLCHLAVGLLPNDYNVEPYPYLKTTQNNIIGALSCEHINCDETLKPFLIAPFPGYAVDINMTPEFFANLKISLKALEICYDKLDQHFQNFSETRFKSILNFGEFVYWMLALEQNIEGKHVLEYPLFKMAKNCYVPTHLQVGQKTSLDAINVDVSFN